MLNYKATLSTFYCGSMVEMENVEDATRIERIFGAQSLVCAQKIAEAMVGEGMYYLEHIHRVVDVRETDEACSLCTWDPHRMWMGVYRKLKEKGESVSLIMDREENAIGIVFRE